MLDGSRLHRRSNMQPFMAMRPAATCCRKTCLQLNTALRWCLRQHSSRVCCWSPVNPAAHLSRLVHLQQGRLCTPQLLQHRRPRLLRCSTMRQRQRWQRLSAWRQAEQQHQGHQLNLSGSCLTSLLPAALSYLAPLCQHQQHVASAKQLTLATRTRLHLPRQLRQRMRQPQPVAQALNHLHQAQLQLKALLVWCHPSLLVWPETSGSLPQLQPSLRLTDAHPGPLWATRRRQLPQPALCLPPSMPAQLLPSYPPATVPRTTQRQIMLQWTWPSQQRWRKVAQGPAVLTWGPGLQG